MKSKLKLKIKKRLYRNIGITLLLLLSFYIAYKIYETQQRIKQRQRQRQRQQFRGVCIEGMSPDQSKEDLKKAIKDATEIAIAECEEDCPVDKKDCPQKSACNKDESDYEECKDESAECYNNARFCKEACRPEKTKKSKSKSI